MKQKSIFMRSFFMFFGLALCWLPQAALAQCGTGETFNTYCYNWNEVAVVAFEFCPTAGSIAQSTINQGIFGGPDNLTVYSGASGSGTGGSSVFSQGGDVSGNTFTALAADDCLIFVVTGFGVQVGFSCAEGFTADADLEVCSKSLAGSTVTLALTVDEVCSDDGNQTIGGGTPTGGVYSGTGVTDNGNGTNFTFNPATPGAGTTTITYTQGGNMGTDDITVVASGSVTMNIATTDRCIDEGTIILPGGGMPTGGIYSGTGITDQGNGLDFSFNPAIAGIGPLTVTYTGPDPCFDTATDVINVNNACTCPAGQTSYFYCQDNNENNVIAFEVCPTAGLAAQATITAGTYGTYVPDPDVLNVYSGASGSGTSGTLISGPLTGDLAGTVIMGNVADQCLIFVSSTGPLGSCQDGYETPLSVCGKDIAPSIAFQSPGDFCISDGEQFNLSGGTPAGGVYKGQGVTDNSNGMTFSFDPAVAGVGVHTLTYTNGDSAKVDVEVFASGVVAFTAPSDLCIDAGIQSGLGGGSPSGGTYSGPGVTDNGNDTYDFNPAVAGLGTHTISYTDATGCMETAMGDVEVLAACGCPSGQQTFFHCTTNNESNLILFEICPTGLDQAVQATINQGTYATFVPDGDVLTVYSGLTGTGTGGTIVFDPQGGFLATTVISSLGENECLTFVSSTGPVGSCQDGFETSLQVCAVDIPPPTRFIASPETFCLNAGEQTGLGGGTPIGGAYSGPGVSDDDNGLTYTFNPADAGVGVHSITYNAFGDAAMDDIEVLALPNVTLITIADLCIDAGEQPILGGGTPTGGIYSGPGVSDDNNGLTYSFDPADAGVGVHSITYTFTGANGCTNTASDELEVFALPTVSFIAPADLCVDAETQQALGGGTPTGGIYSGPGVSDDNNGLTYSFDPADAGVGVHLITYTFTDANGCTNSDSDEVEVFALPTVSFIAAFENICINAGIQTELGGGSPTGGVYSGPGVEDDINGSTYTFNPADAGIGTHTVIYTFTNSNGCTASASVEVSVNEDQLPPAITGILETQNVEGCSVSDAPVAYTTITELEDAGLTISDDCSFNEALTVGHADMSAGSDPVVITRTYTITDETGKSSEVSQTINIEDTTPPMAICQDMTIQLDANGDAAITADEIDNGSNDVCGIAGITVDVNSFTCENSGANTVTLTATDVNGNQGTCTATVTVEDNISPVINECEGNFATFNGEDAIDASTAIDFSATDACGLASTTFEPALITCDQLGLNVDVLVTVTDNNGNPSTCTAIVKVDGLPCGFMDFGEDGIGCEGGNDVSYDEPTETFTLVSEGCYSTAFTTDDAAYVKHELCGDGEIIAHVGSLSPIGQGWAGISMRETEAPGSKKVSLATNLSNFGRREVRTTDNGYAIPQQFFRPGATWIRLVRTGNQFIGYLSTNGVNWQNVMAANVSMASCIQLGLFVTNANGSTVTATFDHVEIIESGVMPSQGTPEIDLVTLNSYQGIDRDFTIFPNPTKEVVTLDLRNYLGQETQIEILNQLGQPIQQRQLEKVESDLEQFDLNALPSGTYFIRVTTNKGDKVKRFLIID